MNVERGSVRPRESWMRFCVAKTAAREIETAISVGSSSGVGVGAAAAGVFAAAVLCGFGVAILMLLRSRWPSLARRAD